MSDETESCRAEVAEIVDELRTKAEKEKENSTSFFAAKSTQRLARAKAYNEAADLLEERIF